jgi:DNA-binding CsgD family transcriptional regulator
LRRQMSATAGQHDYGQAALEALPGYTMIVSADMRILFANTAARQYAASGLCGFCFVRSGPIQDGLTFLAAAHRDDNRTLAALVLAAATGRSGGSMRVRAPGTASLATGLAVLVSPVPGCFVGNTSGDPKMALATGAALVIAREISIRSSPVHGELLRNLFDLSKAEADVALALIGGHSAEDVACARGVSSDTIRTQIKALLRKMDAQNLRDFERIAASVEAMVPVAASHSVGTNLADSIASTGHLALPPVRALSDTPLISTQRRAQ